MSTPACVHLFPGTQRVKYKAVKGLSEASTASQVRLPQFDGREDIDTFLQHFERVASLAGWAKQGWIKRLAPLLQGGAREVYIRLPEQEAKDYELVKKALLSRFRRNAEYYRKQFRTVKKDAAESFTEFVKRLRSLLSRWFCMADADEKDAAAAGHAGADSAVPRVEDHRQSRLGEHLVQRVRQAIVGEELLERRVQLQAADGARRDQLTAGD